MVIDKTLIEDIKSSTNIVDVIGEVVSLNRAGRNYLGLCPFHKEKTPSFNVIEDRQFYHLLWLWQVWRCLQIFRRISSDFFSRSVKVLADRLGIAVSIDVQGKFSGKILLIKLFTIFMRMRLSFTTQSS